MPDTQGGGDGRRCHSIDTPRDAAYRIGAPYERADSNVSGVDGDLPEVIEIDWVQGPTPCRARLGGDGAFLNEDSAEEHDLRLGSRFELQTPTGKVLRLRVEGIFDEPSGGSPFGAYTISKSLFDAPWPTPENTIERAGSSGGVGARLGATPSRDCSGLGGRGCAGHRGHLHPGFDGVFGVSSEPVTSGSSIASSTIARSANAAAPTRTLWSRVNSLSLISRIRPKVHPLAGPAYKCPVVSATRPRRAQAAARRRRLAEV
jgi:hypothetical protein